MCFSVAAGPTKAANLAKNPMQWAFNSSLDLLQISTKAGQCLFNTQSLRKHGHIEANPFKKTIESQLKSIKN